MPEVWVKHVDADDISRFQVSLQREANIDHLKKAIRTELGLPPNLVGNIYTKDNPVNAIDPAKKVFNKNGKPIWDLLCYSVKVNFTEVVNVKKRSIDSHSQSGNSSKRSRTSVTITPVHSAPALIPVGTNGSEAALIKLLQDLSKNTDFQIGLELEGAKLYKVAAFVRKFTSPPVNILPHGFSRVQNFRYPRAKKRKERVIQRSRAIQYFVQHLGATDTSESNIHRPSYMAGRLNEDGEIEQSRTAKPDLTHQRLPLYLELKAKDVDLYDVMKQMTERLYAAVSVNSLVANCCGIVTTPNSALLVRINAGTFPNEKAYRMFVVPFPQNDVYSVWKWLVQHDDNWWFHQNTRAIMASLSYLFGKSVTVKDEFGIRLLNKSSSLVYEVLLPRSHARFGKVLDSKCASFALKINTEEDRFNREKKIVKRLTDKSCPEKIVFAAGAVYADGSVCGEVFDNERLSEFSKNKVSNTTFADGEFVAGFTAMVKGIRATTLKEINMASSDDIDTVELDQLMTREKVVGVCASLKNLHAAGVCHCDIRPSNVLYFPHLKRYALIDYDLAVRRGREVTVAHEGDQFNTAALVLNELRDAIRRQEEGPTVMKWTMDHDWEMLTAYCLQRSVGLTISTLPSVQNTTN